jgi:hypothetical protein
VLNGFLAGLGWTLGVGFGLLIVAYIIGILVNAANKR